jgi:uncharacterized protein (UPF0262 family)
MAEGKAKSTNRLVEVVLDEVTIGRGTSDQEHERAVAIYDLVEENSFAVPGRNDGPYSLKVAMHDGRLTFEVRAASGESALTHVLSLTPFRSILKDYFMICETYYAAIRTAGPAQIEAIDRGRRDLHNEGAKLLAERLGDEIAIDFDTTRRIFTLITALHWKA